MDKKLNQQEELMRRAKIYFASGRLEQSVDLFSYAIEHGGENIDAWMSRGAAQMALGNHALAKQDFSRILVYKNRLVDSNASSLGIKRYVILSRRVMQSRFSIFLQPLQQDVYHSEGSPG